jgi:dihydrofolate reductase
MKAIAAMARNRVIGAGGKIPWHLPEDFRWFKRATLGGVVVMGRKTFESLGKPLPGRRNVVISRTFRFENVEMLPDFEALEESAYAPSPVWIIGGGVLYERALPACSDLFLSLVEGEPEGDTFFPLFEHLFAFESLVETHSGFEVRHYRRKGLPEAVSTLSLP